MHRLSKRARMSTANNLIQQCNRPHQRVCRRLHQPFLSPKIHQRHKYKCRSTRRLPTQRRRSQDSSLHRYSARPTPCRKSSSISGPSQTVGTVVCYSSRDLIVLVQPHCNKVKCPTLRHRRKLKHKSSGRDQCSGRSLTPSASSVESWPFTSTRFLCGATQWASCKDNGRSFSLY